MIPPAEALARVLANCSPLPAERVPLLEATGRVLARPVRADRDLPPAARSAMDGFAVRAADLAAAPVELRLVGEVAAGASARPRVRPGTCVRIFTGANIPPGADAVAIVETTDEVAPDRIAFRAPVEPAENIFPRGENARKGQVLLEKGAFLGPMQVAVCASVGADPVSVVAQPRVGVICSGRELVDSTQRAAPHTERNSNGPALCAALALSGLAQCRVCALAEDDPRDLARKARRALKHCDVLLFVGGVSVGRYDFVPRVIADLGCTTIFHGVAMKPGKPILFARTAVRQLVFGLPGNPLSAMTGFHEFVLPALRKLSGLGEPHRPRLLVRVNRLPEIKLGGRTRFLPSRLRFDADGGAPVAEPVETHSSADLVAGGRCDGVLVLPVESGARDGLYEFHPWRMAL